MPLDSVALGNPLVRDFSNGVVGALLGATASLYGPTEIWLIATCTGVGSVSFVLVSRFLRMRWHRVILASALLVAALALAYVSILDEHARYQSLFIAVDGVRLRSERGLGTHSVVANLNRGTEVFQIDRSWKRYRLMGPSGTSFDYWRMVRTRTGLDGWIYGSFLKPTPPPRLQPREG